jgi:hypothetical protein
MKKRTVGINRVKKQLIAVMEDGKYKRREIKTKKETPLWYQFKEFINSLEINQRFTRGELLYAVYDEKVVPSLRGINNTADTYRSYLRKLGMVVHIKAGIYEKKMHIPSQVTLTTITKATKEVGKWKGWFMPLHKMLGVDESELK